ncbi:MAG: phage portal protein [Anaerolineaceae bacterium]|nr:phage portal protein [Anaerolineaceae bacterium]
MWLLDMFRRDVPITPEVDDVLLKALLSNETITREKALTLPAVSGAVDYICNSIAILPVKLYKRKKGSVEEVTDDSRVRFLNGDTGDTLDAFQMKKAMVEDYLLGKGGYCYIRRYRNEVTGLFYVADKYITVMQNAEPMFKDMAIMIEGKTYHLYDFVKILRNTKDGASGVGLTVEVSKALETAYNTLLYQLYLVKGGGNKKGFLKASRKLGQDEIDILKKAWSRMYANNEENVIVLNNGLEFQEASSSSVEMQLNESKKTLSDEINNIFHISDDFNQTFKNAIYPIIKAFETALNRDLLLEKEKKNYFFEFDVKELLRADMVTRYNAYRTAKETGWMTLNEIRDAENMNQIEGLDVVNVGLGAVLYDINTHEYYTPNTDTTTSMEGEEEVDIEEDTLGDDEDTEIDDMINDLESELTADDDEEEDTEIDDALNDLEAELG